MKGAQAAGAAVVLLGMVICVTLFHADHASDDMILESTEPTKMDSPIIQALKAKEVRVKF